ncbi:MAG TPA: alpha/beta hydrolase, partial [Leptospiraceae bacterium]|nr:alpha/beta hydrolase [Leptospiraceae bacterium]
TAKQRNSETAKQRNSETADEPYLNKDPYKKIGKFLLCECDIFQNFQSYSHKKFLKICFFISFLFPPMYCISLPGKNESLRGNVIMVDKNGNLKDPDEDDHFTVSNSGTETYFIKLIDNIKKSKQKKILIFIHGGLNGEEDGLKRAGELKQAISDDGYYPVFITWNSDLFSSYLEHLTKVRQGEEWRSWGWPTFPFYLIADIFKGIGDIPKIIVHQFNLQFQYSDITAKNAVRIKDQIENTNQSASIKTPELISGEYRKEKTWKKFSQVFFTVATVPTTFISSLFINAAGKQSWDIMERRTAHLFRKSNEFDVRNMAAEDIRSMLNCRFDDHNTNLSCPDNQSPSGALSKFLHHLSKSQLDKTHEITVIAHSMGAIIANQMIRQNPEIRYSNIVYMGAAASINDFLISIPPYLEKHKSKEKKKNFPDVQFYNLMLHPYAESAETNIYDLIIRGSLLEWLDNYFTEPRTLLDRRMGKYINIIQAVHTINPEIRGKIHLLHFDAGENSKFPQTHGEFDDLRYRFWREQFWTNGKENQGVKVNLK